MRTHSTSCRVIYADTDKMGIAYHSNYFRWFEIGRSELFRASDITYKKIEEQGLFLPVTEVFCKYLSGIHYDDLLIIETTIDTSIKAGMKFDYNVFDENGKTILATGYTKHVFLNRNGRIVRPPAFFKEISQSD